jgi:hypothetical protein
MIGINRFRLSSAQPRVAQPHRYVPPTVFDGGDFSKAEVSS